MLFGSVSLNEDLHISVGPPVTMPRVLLGGIALAAVVEARSGARDGEDAQATPISKVLSMMEDMKAKGIAEKEAEATKFASFSQWCGDQATNKKREISEGASKMEELAATIEEAAAEIHGLTSRIEELEEDVGRWKKDKQAASDVRQREALDFKATTLDYGESINAIEGASKTLKQQQGSVPQALLQESFLQVNRQRLVPDDVKSALSSYLQQGTSSATTSAMEEQAPGEAAAYESQSGGILDILSNLADEFLQKKTDLEKEELIAQNGFEQISQKLTDNIETASQEISRKKKRRAETEEAKKEAEGNLAQVQADKDEDQTYLDETGILCEQKASDFEARQEMRAGEIDALSQAIDIIGSSSVKGAGEKNLPQLVQASATSLAQLRSSMSNGSPLQAKAAAFLASRAHRSGSHRLSEVSRQITANPFGKVKKLIKDLITKLMEEGTGETEHKGWCDAELGANKVTRDERAADVNQLNSDIEDLNADIAQLSQDVAENAKACKELDAAMAATTEDRSKNNAANEQTITEAKEAQTAVQEAMAVLKEYYEKAGEATALVQQPASDAPETFDKPYTGMQSEGGGVLDFLEVVLTDFSRLESETSAQEAEEKDEYQKFMFESKKDKALKEKESELKSNTKTEKEEALHTATAELKAVQEQLDKANAYYEKLRPTCVDSGANYEDRVKQREEEIDSLQQTLNILSGQELPTME
eukprot:TRINITY_DN1049_c0_g1_i1.p1 TRINITY_DN1049_c0_g1~~TRINITY_DN1049_c0_g1_i1.p1  ORF type:complete len:708 (-),score=249.43 TRINITY_DN1049_c0_g1_i1:88-2211(-)